MTLSEIFQNGCCWLKTDFHLHTKADKEFTLPPEYNPNEFVKDYIEALKLKDVNIGAITNHNKFDKDEFKALKKSALKKDIFLLPGVELSVKDGSSGIHALIIFDYTSWMDGTDNYIEQFLTSAFEGIHNRENENSRCNYSIEELLKKLDVYKKAGRDSFIIMAHVEQNNGFLNGLDGGRIGDFAKNKLFNEFVLGFQKLCTFDNVKKIKGWYGKNRIPAFVEGSDPKNLNDVGVMGNIKTENGEKEKACYIKIGDYNFDSIKYALKDSKYRITRDLRELSNNFIKSISFIGGKYDGQKINFSREMNNIIGIRGSGKSAILESIRYVLKIDYGTKASDDKYKKGLVDFTLESGGKVIIEVESNGHLYRYEKIHEQEENLYQDDTQINNLSIDILINKPIYFGQKDLSSSDIDFEADLVQRLTGTRLNEIKSRITEKNDEIKKIISSLKQLQGLDKSKEKIQEQINDTRHKLKIFGEKGVSVKLKKEGDFIKDFVKFENYLKIINFYLNDFKALNERYDGFFTGSNFNCLENKDLFEKAKTIFEKIKEGFKQTNKIYLESEKSKENFKKIIEELEERKKTLSEEFAKIKREINLPKLNLNDFGKYAKNLEKLQIKINEISENQKKKKSIEKTLANKISELKNLWHEEYLISKSEIDKFNKNSNSLTLEINFMGRKDQFKESIKSAFKGTGITNTDYEKITQKYLDFVEIYKKQSELSEILSAILLEKFQKRFDEKILDLLTFRVNDSFIIKYHDKPLKDHSLGQRASALILFLLAQKDSELIIIDQPEDDLDNQTIYEDVIKILKKIKGKMQFIFVTHNANIPVLGDSEQIILCSYEDNKFHALTSSIDNKKIQKQIINVMEGGRDAFIRRKEIYNNWEIKD